MKSLLMTKQMFYSNDPEQCCESLEDGSSASSSREENWSSSPSETKTFANPSKNCSSKRQQSQRTMQIGRYTVKDSRGTQQLCEVTDVVLAGRRGAFEGSLFRDIIEANKEAYHVTKRTKRKDVAKCVLQKMLGLGCRFLSYDSQLRNLVEESNEEIMLGKVSKALKKVIVEKSEAGKQCISEVTKYLLIPPPPRREASQRSCDEEQEHKAQRHTPTLVQDVPPVQEVLHRNTYHSSPSGNIHEGIGRAAPVSIPTLGNHYHRTRDYDERSSLNSDPRDADHSSAYYDMSFHHELHQGNTVEGNDWESFLDHVGTAQVWQRQEFLSQEKAAATANRDQGSHVQQDKAFQEESYTSILGEIADLFGCLEDTTGDSFDLGCVNREHNDGTAELSASDHPVAFSPREDMVRDVSKKQAFHDATPSSLQSRLEYLEAKVERMLHEQHRETTSKPQRSFQNDYLDHDKSNRTCALMNAASPSYKRPASACGWSDLDDSGACGSFFPSASLACGEVNASLSKCTLTKSRLTGQDNESRASLTHPVGKRDEMAWMSESSPLFPQPRQELGTSTGYPAKERNDSCALYDDLWKGTPVTLKHMPSPDYVSPLLARQVAKSSSCSTTTAFSSTSNLDDIHVKLACLEARAERVLKENDDLRRRLAHMEKYWDSVRLSHCCQRPRSTPGTGDQDGDEKKESSKLHGKKRVYEDISELGPGHVAAV